MHVDKFTGGIRPYLLLSLLCLGLYLPGLASLPPLDRDESRFVQATRQMLETGDYVRIQFQDEMRAKKPVGAYWLQAASVSLFSDPQSRAVWPYRLPSVLAAWAAALMTFGFGRHLFGRPAALLGAGLLAGSLILVAEAHQAKTDAVLLACVVAAQGALARFYLASRPEDDGGKPAPGWPTALAFWLAQGFGILVKGPIVPVVSLLTIMALVVADRRAGQGAGWLIRLRPITGAAVAAAIAAPWFAAISSATGGAFVGEAIKGDLLPKLMGAQESHGGWPGYYLLLAAVTFWPGSLLLWPGLVQAWRERTRPATRFCLAWIVPAWLMFELVPTKLPHYALPVYPALALVVAAALVGGALPFRARAALVWGWLWVVIGVALAAAVVVLPIRFGAGFDFGAPIAAAGIVTATLLPVLFLGKGRPLAALLALALTAGATFPAVFEGVLPHLDRVFLSRSVAEIVDIMAPEGPVVAAGYSEPSLVFLLGTDTVLTGGSGAAGHLTAHPRGLAVVAGAEQAAFLAQAAQQGILVEESMRVEGFNYSRGKPMMLSIWTRTDGGAR